MNGDLFPTGQTADLANLPRVWEAIDRQWTIAQQEFQAGSTTQILTARRLDSAQPSGPRVYIESWRHLQCAMDNHRALLALLEHYGATPWAPWNLLRPTFEAAFYATWVLDPDDGLTRRRRALRLELNDQCERMKFYDEIAKTPGTGGRQLRVDNAARRARLSTTYRPEADKLGISWKEAATTINVLDEVGNLKAVRAMQGSVFMRATWRSLSGYQHGHAYALLGGSDVTLEAPIPGGHHVRTVINDESFKGSGYATASLLWAAMDLWMRRSQRAN